MKKPFLYFLLLFNFSCLPNIHGQSGFVFIGGDASGDKGSVSFSLGQLAVQAIDNDLGFISEGLQHPQEDINLEKEFVFPDFTEINFFPNPVRKDLYLFVDSTTISNFPNAIYQIKGLDGRFFEARYLDGTWTTIDMENLTPAIYFLQVVSDEKVIKTFKVILL